MSKKNNFFKEAEIFSLLAFFFLIIIASFQFQANQNITKNQAINKKLMQQIRSLKSTNFSLQKENIQLKSSLTKDFNKKKFKKSTYPQAIPISSRDLSFKSGLAVPEEGVTFLRRYLKEMIVPKIENQLKEYDVDMIEIVGHTDGAPISLKGSLDSHLLNTIANNSDDGLNILKSMNQFNQLRAGSNVDLGLIRALIVVNTLKDLQKTGECDCKQIKAFRAYSAGQLYLPGNHKKAAKHTSNSDESRRRVEVRFTKWNPIK